MLDPTAFIHLALTPPQSQAATQTITQRSTAKAPTHKAQMHEKYYPCYIGENGISTNKEEGDKTTPAGDFGLRMVLFRSDRIPPHALKTQLPTRNITPDDGWCDDPTHPQYNQPIKLPFSGSHEKLWMDANYYDLVIVTDYNMNPAIPGKGSAIFIHIKDKETLGCLGFNQKDLLSIVNQTNASTRVKITPDGHIRFYQTKDEI